MKNPVVIPSMQENPEVAAEYLAYEMATQPCKHGPCVPTCPCALLSGIYSDPRSPLGQGGLDPKGYPKGMVALLGRRLQCGQPELYPA